MAEYKSVLFEQMIREFAENEVKPLAQEVDELERFPQETVEKMAKLGLFGIIIPKQYGGAGADVLSYAKEYGMDVIQIHKDALNENDVVLIHDDILATGGTMDAAIQLVKKMGVKTIYVDFILELVGLNGRALLKGKADELNCLFDMEVDE